jgi:hypothetical protein
MQYSTEEKTMWLEDWNQSGKSAWAYAKENGLNPQTFVKWTRSENTDKTSFVELPTRLISPPRQDSRITIEKGDVKIHIPLSEDCVELRAVMEVLGGVL